MSNMWDRIALEKKTRRNFLRISAKASFALPFLTSLYQSKSWASSHNDPSTANASLIQTLQLKSDQPWIIFLPMPNAIHPKNFFPNLNDQSGSWNSVGGDQRVKVKNLADYSNGISPLFNSQLPYFEKVKNYLTLVAGTGWGYAHSGHNFTLGSCLWSSRGFSPDPTPPNSPAIGTVDITLQNLVNQANGANFCNTLNATYASAGGGREYAGKVTSHGPDAIPKEGLRKLNLILDAVGSMNPPNDPHDPQKFDRSKFLDVVLGYINPFQQSPRLSSIDKQTLEAYSDRLAQIRNGLKASAMTNQSLPNLATGSTNSINSIPSNLGNVDGINMFSSVVDAKAYLQNFVSLITSAITSGSHQIINIGNYAPLLYTLADNSYAPFNHHDQSHDWNNVNSAQLGAIQLDYSKGILHHLIYPLMNELISTPHPLGGNYADHGCIYMTYEHATGNFHGGFQGGLDKETFGIPTAIFGKLKGAFNGKEIYDFRYKIKRYNQDYISFALNHMFNHTFFNSFGITNPSVFATDQAQKAYGHYEINCDSNGADLCYQSAYHEDGLRFRKKFPKFT